MTNDDLNLDRWVEDRLAARNPDPEWQPDLTGGLARFHELREAQARSRPKWVWLAVAAAGACLPLMALPITRAFTERCVSACVEESTKLRQFFLRNAAVAGPATAYIQAADRKTAPDFTLDDASGRPVKLSDQRGRVVLLNFWATWCPPCRVEIPWFVEFQKEYGQRDFSVLGVSFDADGWKSVRPYIERAKVNYPVMIGSDSFAQLYGGLDSVPTTLIIDKSGRIAAIHVGLCTRSEYEADIKAVLKER